MENNIRQITLKLTESDHIKFKIICAIKKINMNDRLELWVKKFIKENSDLVEHLSEEK